MSDSNKIRQIKQLWIDTFGDSKEYVDMIIDGYYDDNLCLNIFEDGLLISSSIVIPYFFNTGDNSDISDRKIVGDYLCGLSTIISRRGEGLMKRIIEDIEKNSVRNNSDFTFLIPTDDSLRNYYSKLGYENSAYRTVISLAKEANADINSEVKIERDEINYSNDSVIKYSNHLIRLSSYNKLNISAKFYQYDINEFIELILTDEENLYRKYLTKSTSNEGSEMSVVSSTDNINSGYTVILHSCSQWRDIFEDFLRDDATICVMRNMHNVILSICVITVDNKIYPLYGSIDDQLRNIQFFYDFIVKNDKNSNRESLTYKIVIFHPEYAKLFSETILGSPYFSSWNITVGREKYGMAKILREGIDPSKIVIGYMFD